MASNPSFLLPPVSELFKDPFKHPTPNRSTEQVEQGSKCEISYSDARFNSKGDRVYLSAGTKRTFDAPTNSENRGAALLSTKYYDKSGQLEYTETEVQSSYIREAVEEIIDPDYPDMTLSTERLVFRDFSRCLFFHHQQFREYGQAMEDEAAARHINLVLEYLYKDLGHSMQVFKDNVEDRSQSEDNAEPRLDFPNLWMAFRPGDLVTKEDRGDIKSVYRVVKTHYVDNLDWGTELFRLTLRSLECNGTSFGFTHSFASISNHACVGYTPLRDLSITPVKYLRQQSRDDLLTAALERGKRFIELSSGVHHCEYHGTASLVTGELEDEDVWPTTTTKMIKGRVMIDSAQFALALDHLVPTLRGNDTVYSIATRQYKNIPEEDILLALHKVMGFSLTAKRWAFFNIELVKDFAYNEDAFGRLVLPSLQKDMVRALVSAHEKGSLGFDDIVVGKGKGMTILLHGTPGVGKTLTAESVAEYARRPLYAITAADFADRLSTTEKRLANVLDLTAHWNAVLLIDEADVFLHQRSISNIERNAIVSIFLRALEYYNGLLILTTNRVVTIDTAFKSRIHLGIKYHPLTSDTRRGIWKAFVQSVESTDGCPWLTEDLLDDLAKYKFDGRMIKNAVRMAHALAVDETIQMGPSHLHKAVEAMHLFEQDMAQAVADEKKERELERQEDEDANPRKRRRLELD